MAYYSERAKHEPGLVLEHQRDRNGGRGSTRHERDPLDLRVGSNRCIFTYRYLPTQTGSRVKLRTAVQSIPFPRPFSSMHDLRRMKRPRNRSRRRCSAWKRVRHLPFPVVAHELCVLLTERGGLFPCPALRRIVLPPRRRHPELVRSTTSWRTGWYGGSFSAAPGSSSASCPPRQHTSTSSTGSGRSKNSLEQQNMRLRLMHLVVFPPETLSPRQSATHPHIISHTGSPPKSSFAEIWQDSPA